MCVLGGEILNRSFQRGQGLGAMCVYRDEIFNRSYRGGRGRTRPRARGLFHNHLGSNVYRQNMQGKFANRSCSTIHLFFE